MAGHSAGTRHRQQEDFMKKSENQKHGSLVGIAALLMVLVMTMVSCDTGISPLASGSNLGDLANALALVGNTGQLSASQSFPLLAGENIEAGEMEVAIDESKLSFTYQTKNGWKLSEVHLSIGTGIASIPVNNAGNPVVGAFAFKATNLSGIESYTFEVPLAHFNVEVGTILTVAGHAVVSKTSSDGSVQKESAWASGTRINSKKGGNWATFFTITIGETEENPIKASETAFAFGGALARTFDSFDASNRWGWTNGPLAAGSYRFPIYAAAGRNIIENGFLVGYLDLVYNGSEATVAFEMLPGFSLTETHLYVGNDPLPRNARNEETVAPGQYPASNELDHATSDSYVIGNLSGSVYVIAHAVVHGDF
jgi:hypothetical protein